MNKEEYDTATTDEIKNHKRRMASIAIEFATSNNPVKIGDKIKDHHKYLMVDKMITSLGQRYPCMVYEGKLLTAKGAPFKNGKPGAVYQSNLKDINP